MEPVRPFRWDLVRREQLGSLLSGTDEPELWFQDELVHCAARVLAHCADGELYFVGRSPDSLYDLLGGALSGTTWQDRIHQLPLSLFRGTGRDLTPDETAQLRVNLAGAGLSPYELMRGRTVVFADLVAAGSTFENLYAVLRDWIDDEDAQWDVIRVKLRFVGITWREKTSPKTWRWHQHAAWTRELPARAVRNVSLAGSVWNYFGNSQPKTAVSFWRTRWGDPSIAEPSRSAEALQALAEAVAVVEAGRTPEVRNRIAQVLADEQSASERWSRELRTELRRPT